MPEPLSTPAPDGLPVPRRYLAISVLLLTLVLVIFLQHAQNRDSQATHLKLNELLVALEQPSDDVVAAEDKPDHELERLAERHRKAAGSGS